MNHLRLVPVIAVGLVLAQGAGKVFAQAGPYVSPGPYGYSQYGYGTPRLSPYLNLLRGGNTAANYFMGVVPEVERRANARLFTNQIQDLERRVQGIEEPGELFPRLSETGHPAVFGNYGSYFGTMNQGRPLAGSGALNRPPTRR
jgi:hypothetical protein